MLLTMASNALNANFMRQTQKFAKDLVNLAEQSDKTIDELSLLVHDFYLTIGEKIEAQSTLSTSDSNEDLVDNIERTLNEIIYPVISARIINEDEEKIMAFQKRIRSLNWITVEHLEIDIDFKHPNIHDLLDKAICQMVEVNSRTSSLDKLSCIVQCSKSIFELLQFNPSNTNLAPVSADQFLPVLVFVVIQANPPMLPADLKYITSFSNPKRLTSGETGYYFTNLCCALEFIEKACGSSLNISEEEFQRYVNGEAVPETKSQFSIYLCDGLRTICSNDAALEDLKQRSIARQSKIEKLREHIDGHLETNRVKLREMQSFALSLKEKLKPNFPRFYTDLLEQNKDFAVKLLPSYLFGCFE